MMGNARGNHWKMALNMGNIWGYPVFLIHHDSPDFSQYLLQARCEFPVGNIVILDWWLPLVHSIGVAHNSSCSNWNIFKFVQPVTAVITVQTVRHYENCGTVGYVKNSKVISSNNYNFLCVFESVDGLKPRTNQGLVNDSDQWLWYVGSRIMFDCHVDLFIH